MRRLAAAVLAALLVTTAAPAAVATPVPSARAVPAQAVDPVAALRWALSTSLDRSTARALGVVVEVDGLGRVLEWGGGALLPPASVAKLYVAAGALLAFGPDLRLRTEVRVTATPDGAGVVPGDLVLVGGGDPSLTQGALEALARAVAAQGIRHVQGRLVVDDTWFDRARTGPGWKPTFVPGELGPLSALVVDGNHLRRDPAYLSDPARGGGEAFARFLAAAGVAVAGGVAVGPPPNRGDLVATHLSPTLGTLVARMAKSSDNGSAETLLKVLGAAGTGHGTTASGAAVVRDVLARHVGLRPAPLADGSGLSAWNRTTANHVVDLLRVVGASAMGDELVDSLAVACVDGTMRRRLCGTPASGRLAAKTGTLSGVVALAGVVTTASGRPARFAVLLSGVTSQAAARAAVDRLAATIAASTA